MNARNPQPEVFAEALQEQINAAPAAPVSASGYIVFSAKLKRPIRRKTSDEAINAAMSHTKSRGATARVYAMVPVGEARTGAEWRGA